MLLVSLSAGAQKTVVVDSSQPGFRTVISGQEYQRGGLHNLLWGKHYRKEWTTPVQVPVIDLSRFAGGLKPIEQGGGRQTKTLRLEDKDGHQYVLRSIDKDYGKALPDIVHGTFIESLAKDQVSTGHPFASITVTPMITAAGVYHTNPRIVFVPYTPILDSFNTTFANTLCLLEERPDDDESNAPNFGRSDKVRGTDKMYGKLFEDYEYRVDQKAFVRARLFDMFLGDWGRHDDQWRWAQFDSSNGSKVFRPIPRDRDQAYTRFDGFLLRRILGTEELEHLRTFSGDIKNVKKYNFPGRYIDRQLTNEVSRETWIQIAEELQQSLTDAVIEKSIHQLPPELYAISGPSLIADLKSRRGHLKEYAAKYYRFLTQQVEIVGTKNSELFDVVRTGTTTTVSLYDLHKDKEPRKKPFYSRTFNTSETQELRLYGLDGHDVFRVSGEPNSIRVRIIGGPQKDSMVNTCASAGKLRYYDNPGNDISGPVHAKLSKDTAINRYEYEAYKYNVGYTIKSPSYSNTRGVFLNAGYTYTRHQWRHEPYGWKQTLRVNYSLSNSSFGGDYEGIFNQVFGHWNLVLGARYDQKLKNYYLGVGNETVKAQEIDYYRLFTEEGYGTVGLNHALGKNAEFTVSGFYQTVNVKPEDGHYIVQHIPGDPSVFNKKDFAGAAVNFRFMKVNNPVVPTSGVGLTLEASHTDNLTDDNKSFNRYIGTFGFYLPLVRNVSLAVRTGGAHVTGDPEFYQLNWLGGGQNLRGFHRQRFYGRTAFYDNNELRWLPDVHTHLFNGKMGLAAFLDEGRVWNPGEDSDKWHVGYGGGVIIVPFNKLSLGVYYGLSQDDKLVHIRLGKFF